jgi:hypothetical protein
MHSMPYLIKNPAGTWCVQRKVPGKLQAAVALILGGKRSTQVYLKKSLATKDRREATRRAPHALADIERTLREAAALTQVKPQAAVRTTLTDSEIKRMAEYVYAKRQDIGLAFGHTIRRYAKTLLGDHDHAA